MQNIKMLRIAKSPEEWGAVILLKSPPFCLVEMRTLNGVALTVQGMFGSFILMQTLMMKRAEK